MFAWLFVMAAGGVLTSCTSDEKEISGSPDNKYPMEFVGQVFNQEHGLERKKWAYKSVME